MGSAGDEHHDDGPDDDDRDEPWEAPPHPLDRIWRHPTELPPAAPRARRNLPIQALVRPFAVGALGALVTVAVLSALGAFDDGDDPSTTPIRAGDADGATVKELPTDNASRGIVLVTVRDETGARRASGVCVRHAGEVLTTATAIGSASTAVVTTADGQTHDATLIGRDDATDLVLLAVSSPVPAVPVSEATLRVGDQVWVLGGRLPGATHAWRSAGIVSATDAMVVADPGPTFAGLLETDAPSPSGVTGGALVDDAGEVSGIVISAGPDRRTTFALPISVAISIAKDLRDDGIAAHGALALTGVDSPEGPVVTEVEPDGAAARAGVLPGDVVVAVERRPVLDMGELTATIRRYGPGKVVALSMLRAGEPVEVDVQLSSTAPQAMS